MRPGALLRSAPLRVCKSLSPAMGLTLVRTVWTLITAVTVSLWCIGLPTLSRQLGHPTRTVREAISASGLSPQFYDWYLLGLVVSIGAAFIVAGMAIFWLRSREPIAQLVSLVLVTVGGSFSTPSFSGTFVLTLGSSVREFVAWTGLLLVFYLFPDGRFVPAWSRHLAILFAAVQAYSEFAVSGFHLTGDLPTPVLACAFVVSIGAGLYGQVFRYRRVSSREQQLQTKWVVAAIVLVICALTGFQLLHALGSPEMREGTVGSLLASTILVMSMFFLPLSVGFSILRYRLWDLKLFISRALMYAILSALVAITYVAVVAAIGTLLQSRAVSLVSFVAGGAVAVLFFPLRRRLQRAANRLLYGERDEPYAVLSRLGHHLEGTLAPNAVLLSVASTVAQALKLPYAAITLRDETGFRVAASYGARTEDTVALPLVHQAETVGQLILSPRRNGEVFGGRDLALLEDIARQASVVAYNVYLADALQHSREQLVTTREEERRRLRRDLHDGLGPVLAGVTLTADAIRNVLRTDPDVAQGLLENLIAQAETATKDVRRVVYALRPPVLDELGLEGALREQAARLSNQSLSIRFDARTDLTALPAAVEVAAYRIVLEALTNAVRHSEASVCNVLIDRRHDLLLDIADDGRGMNGSHSGVGLRSMRERASELGGSLVVEPAGLKGTRIQARLPLVVARGVSH